MGGSASKSKSESSADASSKEEVWGTQGDALEKLYGSAADTFGGQEFYTNAINQIAQNLGPQFQGLIDQTKGGMDNLLAGGSYGDTSDVRNALMDSMRSTQGGSQMGNMYNSIVGGSGNTYVDPMVDAMKRSGMENLDRMQSNAGLDATAAGQGGSSRHAMQNAMLAKDANNDMLDRETMMRGGAYDKDLQMKMDIARQADAGIQSTQDRYMQMLGGADQNVGQGIGAGNSVYNLGMGSMSPYQQASQSPWDAMTNYTNVLGRPTVLGSSNSSMSGDSKGKSGSASLTG